MKKIWLGLALLASMLGNAPIRAANADASDGPAQAEDVVSAYLGALVQGDLHTIRQLLGGMFLRKKEMLLNSPAYSARLAELYSGARYVITHVEGRIDGQWAVDAQLDTGAGSELGTRFIVASVTEPSTGQIKYLITDEID